MNRKIQQMARTMLDESRTPATFSSEATFSVVTILNKANVQVNRHQTPYELWYGKPPTIKHFRFFGSKVSSKGLMKNLVSLNPE